MERSVAARLPDPRGYRSSAHDLFIAVVIGRIGSCLAQAPMLSRMAINIVVVVSTRARWKTTLINYSSSTSSTGMHRPLHVAIASQYTRRYYFLGQVVLSATCTQEVL